MRPYLINTLINLATRPDVAKLFKTLSEANRTLYEGILSIYIKPIGMQLYGKAAEVLFPLQVDEENDRLVIQSYKPPGTVLKKVVTSQEEQLAVYDRIREKYPHAKSMLIIACELRKLWLNFDYESLENKLKTLKCPYIKPYVYAEFGTYTPYDDPKRNLVNDSSVKVLVFK